jgi:hypothetical protein
MKTLSSFGDKRGRPCVVCGTYKKGKFILIPIYGTERKTEGICEGTPVHLDCLRLMYFPPDVKDTVGAIGMSFFVPEEAR